MPYPEERNSVFLLGGRTTCRIHQPRHSSEARESVSQHRGRTRITPFMGHLARSAFDAGRYLRFGFGDGIRMRARHVVPVAGFLQFVDRARSENFSHPLCEDGSTVGMLWLSLHLFSRKPQSVVEHPYSRHRRFAVSRNASIDHGRRSRDCTVDWRSGLPVDAMLKAYGNQGVPAESRIADPRRYFWRNAGPPRHACDYNSELRIWGLCGFEHVRNHAAFVSSRPRRCRLAATACGGRSGGRSGWEYSFSSV